MSNELRVLYIVDNLTKNKVSVSTNKTIIYTCGPTTYDDAHIGNMRPSIIASLLSSMIEKILGGSTKNYQNITDIDDKIIKRSTKEKMTPDVIAAKYSKNFISTIEELKLEKFKWKKVTDNLSEIENYIDILNEKKLIIDSDSDIQMNVSKDHKNYGRFVTLNEVDDNTNFAVWKKVNKLEYGFNSKYGWGRPGWHTECSAIIYSIVGNNSIDIHISGRDIKFPHNENELFQHTQVTGKPLSKCWIHVGNVKLKNEKMSKSLGNIILAKDVLKNYSSSEIKLWFFSTKYNNDIVFSREALDMARNQLDTWSRAIKNGLLVWESQNKILDIDNGTIDSEIVNALLDDISTPKVVALLNKKSNLIKKEINDFYKSKKINSNIERIIVSFIKELQFFLNIDEITFSVSKEEKKKFSEWRKWLEKKEWEKSDKLRQNLIEKKVLL